MLLNIIIVDNGLFLGNLKTNNACKLKQTDKNKN